MNKILEKFYCFGDSISFGQHITLHKTWTSKLSQQLDEEILDREIIFSNPSVNGNTTKMALDRLQYDVLNHKPNHILIQFGLNDCNYWEDSFGFPRTEKNDFFKNIFNIIKKVSSIKVSNIFLCTIHPTNKGIIKIGEKKIPYDKIQKEYSAIIKDIYFKFKNQYPLTLLDLQQYFESNEQFTKNNVHLLNDGIHLSHYGHKLYSNYVIPNVIQVLKDENTFTRTK